MKGKHIIRAVNFNNGEAFDLQTLNERLKSEMLENAELNVVLGGCDCRECYKCSCRGDDCEYTRC
jgi:hypothetical protein